MRMTKHQVVLIDTKQSLIPLLHLSKIGCTVEFDGQNIKVVHPKRGRIHVDRRDGTPVISEAEADMFIEELENAAMKLARGDDEDETDPDMPELQAVSSRIATAEELEKLQQQQASDSESEGMPTLTALDHSDEENGHVVSRAKPVESDSESEEEVEFWDNMERKVLEAILRESGATEEQLCERLRLQEQTQAQKRQKAAKQEQKAALLAPQRPEQTQQKSVAEGIDPEYELPNSDSSKTAGVSGEQARATARASSASPHRTRRRTSGAVRQ